MTGFFEKKFTKEDYSVLISIKTLNHRYFDWYFKGNSILSDLENRLRHIAQKEFKRGRVEASIEIEFSESFKWEVSLDNNLINNILNLLKPTLKKFKKNIMLPLDTIFRFPGVFTIKPSSLRKEDYEFIEECFRKIVYHVKELRKNEGELIKKDIENSKEKIEYYLRKIKRLAKNQPKLIEEKLRQKIENMNLEPSISEERLSQEVFFYIQRLDITEEINRLSAHLKRMSELMSYGDNEPVGRKIEFLTQEIYREINTIASKSQELDIIKYAVEIKGEIEKIRQQIQNIE